MISPSVICETLTLVREAVVEPVWLFGGVAVDFHVGRWTRPHSDIDLVALDPAREGVKENLQEAGFKQTVDLGWHTRWGRFDREIGEIELDFLEPARPSTGVLVVCPGHPLGAVPGRYEMVPRDLDPNRWLTLDGTSFRVCSAVGEWVWRFNGMRFIPERASDPKIDHDISLLESLLSQDERRQAERFIGPPSPLRPGDCSR